MKTKAISMTALALSSAAILTLTSCSSTSESAPPEGSAWVSYSKGAPGGVRVETIRITATLTAIDKADRKATLLLPDGKTLLVKMSPKAVNFDQLRVGDPITAIVTERIVASLAKEDGTSDDGAAAGVAPKGDQKGGLSPGPIQYIAKIIAIDLEKRTATLQFEHGQIETTPVFDKAMLSQSLVGREVVYRVTESIATWVEKAQ